MAFNKANWALSSKGFDGDAPSEFKYFGGADTLADITADGYFDSLRNTADNEVRIGDRIYVRAFDLDSLIPLIVKQVDPTLTTSTVISKDTNDNLVVENTLKVDNVVEKTLDNGVLIEGSLFEQTGSSEIRNMVGQSALNINDVLMHYQSKRDIDIFVESDTDDVATNDNPLYIMTQSGNKCMIRFGLEESTGNFMIDVGGAGAPGNAAGVIIRTGGDYISAPATGTRPDYQGGGKVNPSDGLFIRGTDQAGQFFGGIELPTSGGTPSILDHYEEGTISSLTWTGAFSSGQGTSIDFARLGCIVALAIPGESAAQNTVDTVTLGAGALPARIRPLTANTHQPIMALNNNGTISIGQVAIRIDGEVEISLNGGGNFAGTGTLAWINTVVFYILR